MSLGRDYVADQAEILELQLRQFEPINDNMVTNGDVLSGEIHNPEDGNYPLIVLCADCMTDFLRKVDGLWKNH